MERKKVVFLALTAWTILAVLASCEKDKGPKPVPDELPKIDSAAFTNPTLITNSFYGPGEGQIYIYEGGLIGQPAEEEIRIERKTTTKIVMGVTCIIQRDVVSVGGVTIEDTDDWLAQDDDGNLWYFGEFVKNYNEQGNFMDNDGSWEAGADGALPGYWMPGNPVAGMEYFQEWYSGEAEDQAEVLSLQETVTIQLGTYTNCLVTKDFTQLESDEYEKKYYAPGIGLIKEEKFEDNVLVETVELVEIIE